MLDFIQVFEKRAIVKKKKKKKNGRNVGHVLAVLACRQSYCHTMKVSHPSAKVFFFFTKKLCHITYAIAQNFCHMQFYMKNFRYKTLT